MANACEHGVVAGQCNFCLAKALEAQQAAIEELVRGMKRRQERIEKDEWKEKGK